MKLFIDDIRNPTGEGWVIARDYDSAITYLQSGNVTEISFDHDLGENSKSGYDIVCWIEQALYTGILKSVPVMNVHSANPVGRANIDRAIRSIYSRF